MTTYARPKDIPESLCVSGTIVTLSNGRSYKRNGKKWVILCEHGIRRSTCRKCGGARYCEHNKEKRYCQDCGGSGLCEHNKRRYYCLPCGGTGICEHEKYRQDCVECNGSQFCVHEKKHKNCVECGGSNICEHGKQCKNCVKCGGSNICEHEKYRYGCGECGPRSCKAKCGTLAKYEKYEGYCLRCFIHLFPDKQVTRNYKVKEKYVTDAIMALLQEHKIEVPVTLDKPVGGCSSKRPDLFIDLLTHVVIVEVDEVQHRAKDYTSCDSAREVILFVDVAERPCVFLRFNPDSYTDKDNKQHKSCFKYNHHGICVIGDKKEFERRIAKLFNKVSYHLNVIPTKSITKEYLYYDPM